MKLGLQDQSADANRRLASRHAEALNPARGDPPQALGLGRGSVGRGGAGRSGAPLPGCLSEAGTVCGWVLCTAWGLNQVSMCRPGVNYISPSQSLPPEGGVKDRLGGGEGVRDELPS